MVSPMACCRLPGLCARAVASRLMRLRIVYKLLLLVCLGLWVVLPLWQLLDANAYRQRRACYASAAAVDSLAAVIADHQSGTQRLPDVLRAMRQPTPDRTIFFIDASCRRGVDGGVLQLNSRQVCCEFGRLEWSFEHILGHATCWKNYIIRKIIEYETGTRIIGIKTRFIYKQSTSIWEMHVCALLYFVCSSQTVIMYIMIIIIFIHICSSLHTF